MPDQRRFKLTEDHIKLLRRAWVRWEDCEYGAPAIDPKRPYGNGDVEMDIAEILGWELTETIDGPVLSPDQWHRARQLHTETETAFQIFLQEASVRPGDYETTDAYSNVWLRSR